MKTLASLVVVGFLVCAGCADTANTGDLSDAAAASKIAAENAWNDKSLSEDERKQRLRDAVRKKLLVADNALDSNPDYLITDTDFVDPILDKLFAEDYEFWMNSAHPDFDMFSGLAVTRYHDAMTSSDGINRLKKRILERFAHPVVTEKITHVPASSENDAELRQAVQTVVAAAQGNVPDTVHRAAGTPAHDWIEINADYGLMPGKIKRYRRILADDMNKDAKAFFEDNQPATTVVAAKLNELLQQYPKANLLTLRMQISGDPGPYVFVYRVEGSLADSSASLIITFPHIAYASAGARTREVRIEDGDLSPYMKGQISFYSPPPGFDLSFGHAP